MKMSGMPEPDASGQRGGNTQQSGGPQPGYGGPQSAYAGPQGSYGGPPGGYGQQRGSQPGNASPVNRHETKVTGRRVVQYLIDAFLVSLVPSLVSIPFDRSGSTLLHILGGIVFFVLFVLIGLWYWVIRPHGHTGQTFGMQLLGLRVISKDGGPASMAQLFIRWVCLIFDALPYTWPFTGLVGFIVILCSRNRQRIGDHAARTLVISTVYDMQRSPQLAGGRGENIGTSDPAQGWGMGQGGQGQASGMGQGGQGQGPGMGQGR
jgi:uncharacterized RDD family membrane protein YckC